MKKLSIRFFAFLCNLRLFTSTITLDSSNFPKTDSSDIKVYTIGNTTFIDSTAANDSLTIDETLERL